MICQCHRITEILKSEELTFHELKLVVNIKQAVAFRSNQTKTEIGSLFADYDLGWSGRSNEDDPSPKYLPPTLGSGDNEAKLKNHRRMNIDLEPARRGLPAQHRK